MSIELFRIKLKKKYMYTKYEFTLVSSQVEYF